MGEWDCVFEKLMKWFYIILNRFYFLWDSGNFKEFISVVDSMFMNSKDDLELKFLIFFEKSVVVSY